MQATLGVVMLFLVKPKDIDLNIEHEEGEKERLNHSIASDSENPHLKR